jgi:hypothetical protein
MKFDTWCNCDKCQIFVFGGVGMRGKEGVGLFCIYWLLELVWGLDYIHAGKG